MSYLELHNVFKTFSSVTAVRDFSLDIDKGSLVSFLGPSGCGKTTTLRMIAGFEMPDSGTIQLDNEDITQVAPNKRDIGMVFQAYALFPNMTVRQNVAFGLKMKKTPKEQLDKRIDTVLEMVRLADTAKRFPTSFPEVNNNELHWHAPWRYSRACCCWMNPFRRLMLKCALRCAARFAVSSAGWALRRFT